jgi:hypothetical protein
MSELNEYGAHKGITHVDAEDSLRENNTSLLNKNSRMCPVPPQGVLKGLNTSFAAAILRDLRKQTK